MALETVSSDIPPTTTTTTPPTTTDSGLTPATVSGWLGLGPELLSLGQGIASIFTGKSSSDQEKALALQGQLMTYQQQQQQKQQTIIIIAAISIVVAVIATIYFTHKK